MPVILNATLKVEIVGGSTTSRTHTFTVDAYEVIEITIAAGRSETVAVRPATGVMHVLFLSSDHYTSLTCEADASGTVVALDAPLLLTGTGGGGMLGAVNSLAFSNGHTVDANVRIIVGRTVA
jgi:hypothetical protein